MHPILQNLGLNSFDDDIVTISDNKYHFNVILLNTNGNFAKINYSAIVDFKMVDRMYQLSSKCCRYGSCNA